MARGRRTILLSGMLATVPWQGGATWAVLQYLLGLRQLGHEVFFVEPLAEGALLPSGATLAGSENATYFQQVTAAYGLASAAALLLVGTRQTVGMRYEELRRAACRADVLVNIAGMLGDEALSMPIPTRVYLDLDPAFTQLWQAAQGIDMRFAGHTHFVSVGQALGGPDCTVPTCGRPWLTMPPPVVLAHWPVCRDVTHEGLTTVANWRGYGSIEYGGIFYGQKAHSWRQLIALPTLTREVCMPALAIHPAEQKDLAALAHNGWYLLEPVRVAGTPDAYRRFVQGSRAELGVAKSGYVAARCGWFSDRSVCYLASGRPVIAQDTGFAPFLPVGAGLLSFKTSEEALAAIEAVMGDYERHARAARAIAEEHFDSDKVLARFLQQIGAMP